MAYTVSIPSGCKAVKQGNRRVTYADVTFTGSYVAGGEAITAQDLALKSILYVYGLVTEGAAQTAANAVTWNRATGKLMFYTTGAVVSTSLGEKVAAAYAATTVGRLIFVGQ